jgi:hypothetical protein
LDQTEKRWITTSKTESPKSKIAVYVLNNLGSTFVACGDHSRFGTRNFTLPLLNGQYIEVVCPLDRPSQDGKTVAAIEKITIAVTDHLSDSWFKIEILSGLNGADVEFIDPSANDGEYGIVAVNLMTPT